MEKYAFLFASILLNVTGQTFMKLGANALKNIEISIPGLLNTFMNPWIIMGLGAYGISTIFWIISLSKFDLSVAYPFLSLGYILVLIVSVFLFKENINELRVLGVVLIMVGVVLISQR